MLEFEDFVFEQMKKKEILDRIRHYKSNTAELNDLIDQLAGKDTYPYIDVDYNYPDKKQVRGDKLSYQKFDGLLKKTNNEKNNESCDDLCDFGCNYLGEFLKKNPKFDEIKFTEYVMAHNKADRDSGELQDISKDEILRLAKEFKPDESISN